MAMVVVLPAPLPPSSPSVVPLGHREADAVDGQYVAVALGQPLDLDDVPGCAHGWGLGRHRRHAKCKSG